MYRFGPDIFMHPSYFMHSQIMSNLANNGQNAPLHIHISGLRFARVEHLGQIFYNFTSYLPYLLFN